MEFWEWVSQNWFNLFSIVGILAGLDFTATSLRSETKTRRVANLLAITANHREIWKEFLNDPDLARVLDASADLMKQSVTDAEEIFATLVILHIGSVYYAITDQLVVKLERLRRDVSEFISLPIPKAVWEKSKFVQNDDVVARHRIVSELEIFNKASQMPVLLTLAGIRHII